MFHECDGSHDRGCVYVGFGSLCIVPQLLFPFLLSEALMGMAFPLFVLMACESDPRAQFEQGMQCTPVLHYTLVLGSIDMPLQLLMLGHTDLFCS